MSGPILEAVVSDPTLAVKPADVHRSPWHTAIIWFFRLLLVTPFVLMGPEVVSMALGRPHSVANVSNSTADVLGTSALIIFMMMLAVTPVHTLTGWQWHRVLRRDYGVAMFLVAATDLVLAAIATGDTFHGGFFDRVGGHTFLLAGTLSVLLLIPVTLTANRRARKWLGPHWRSVHRLVYVVWATILLHLAFLFAFRSLFIDSLVVSFPLVILRIPRVRQRWASSRRARTHRHARRVGVVVLAALFIAGIVPFFSALVHLGGAAFLQHPPHD
jgi:sulfoxide reductase heme-binding subunit YedZ